MKTIIIYSSKYGSAADCAKYLESGLTGFRVLADIGRTDPKTIRWEDFDTVVIGSSIYIGTVSKKIRALCRDYSHILLKKRVGIFLCCGFSQQFNEYSAKNFPEELLKNAIAIKDFGGEARLDQMKTIDKLIMKAATYAHSGDLHLLKENMDQLIMELNGAADSSDPLYTSD